MKIDVPISAQSVVSVKGQTVIPKEIREALGIKAGTKLSWTVKGRSIYVFPVPEDPVHALMGILKDSGYTFEDFLRERNEERKRERVQEEKEEQRWRGMSSTPQQ
jgi:AbrB family looped-hinge helix DNA binding protein